MNRSDLQQLSNVRAKEALSLFETGHFSGSYYLAGYAVECALKACIARTTQQFDFPDKDRASKSYTHNLKALVALALLDAALSKDVGADRSFAEKWQIVQRWDESSRYELHSQSDAQNMMESISGPGGLLAWIARSW